MIMNMVEDDYKTFGIWGGHPAVVTEEKKIM